MNIHSFRQEFIFRQDKFVFLNIRSKLYSISDNGDDFNDFLMIS